MQGSRRAPLEVRRPIVWLVATALLVVAADQLTKALVRSSLQLDEAVPVIPGVFDIAHVRNSGAAFGVLPGRRELFIAVCVFMLGSVAVYWWRARPTAWPVVVSLGLVVGGAIGNFIDRVFIGHVTDLLAFSFFAPVFNIADSAIFLGVGGLIVWVFFGPSSARDDAGGADDALGSDVPESTTLAAPVPPEDPTR